MITSQLKNKTEAKELLGGVSLSTLDRLIATGELIPTRVGRRVFFRKTTLEKFIRDAEQAGTHRARGRAIKLNRGGTKRPSD